MTSRLILLLTAFVVVIALVPTSVSAFSFSSFLKDDESSASNATEVEEASSEEGSQAEAGVSDGTDIKSRQPILDAEAWFLTEQEIT
jgi:phospholipase D1/2